MNRMDDNPTAHLEDVEILREAPYDEKPGESETDQRDVDRIPEVEITQEDLYETTERDDNWLIFGGGYEGQRYFPGDGMTPENVGELELEYQLEFSEDGDDGQTSPILVHGDPPIMYPTFGPDRVYAIDARNGDILWKYTYESASGASRGGASPERGAAVIGDLLLKSTLDFGVSALNRYTGEEEWYYNGAAAYRDDRGDYLVHPELGWGERSGPTSSFPPLVYEGKILKGSFGAEWGIKGFFDAIDLDGVPQWRASMVPRDEWVGETWVRGGGTAWASGAVDPENDLVIAPVANPAPRYGTVRPGWNIFTGGKVAFDTETGEYQWHYQDAPHDLWDYDSPSPPIVYNAEVEGEERRLVSWPPKSGWVFTVDAESGKLVQRSEGYVQHHNMWEMARRGGTEDAPWVMPQLLGGTNPDPSSYHRDSRTMIVKGSNVPAKFGYEEVEYRRGERYDGINYELGLGADVDAWNGNGSVVAGVDPVTGEVKWQDWTESWMGSHSGGSVTTATGVTFAGFHDEFIAYETETGERIWSDDLGQIVNGAPICWHDPQEEKTLVAITSGSAENNLLNVYSIGG